MNTPKVELVSYVEKKPQIQKIRIKVFQEEQGVTPELEFDGLDDDCQHLLAYLDDKAVGTSRIRSLNSITAKIERVAVLKSSRGQGVGTKLMKTALEIIAHQGFQEVVVNAQEYVQALYGKFGFQVVGERFNEAGIPHVKMVKYFHLSPEKAKS